MDSGFDGRGLRVSHRGTCGEVAASLFCFFAEFTGWRVEAQFSVLGSSSANAFIYNTLLLSTESTILGFLAAFDSRDRDESR